MSDLKKYLRNGQKGKRKIAKSWVFTTRMMLTYTVLNNTILMFSGSVQKWIHHKISLILSAFMLSCCLSFTFLLCDYVILWNSEESGLEWPQYIQKCWLKRKLSLIFFINQCLINKAYRAVENIIESFCFILQ